jgi:hypothetical protein
MSSARFFKRDWGVVTAFSKLDERGIVARDAKSHAVQRLERPKLTMPGC